MILSLILPSKEMVALVLAGVAKAHPEASVTSVQMVFTLITLIVVPAMLIAGKLVNRFTKKKLLIVCCLLMLGGGLMGYFCYASLLMLYVASALIGFGNGMLNPIVSGLIAEHFTGDERASVNGVQTLFVSGGAILLSLLVNFLGRSQWQGSYLLFLLTIPVLLVLIFLLPAGSLEKAENGKKGRVLTPYLMFIILQVFLYSVGFMTFMTNISLYTDALGVGNASFMNSMQSIGCVIIGLLLAPVMRISGKYCFALASVFGAVSMVILCLATGAPMLLLGSLVLGLGFGLLIPAGCVLIPDAVPASAITMGISLMLVAYNVGGFINPYIVTLGAQLINNNISTRFAVAAVILALNVLLGVWVANKVERKQNQTDI